MSNNPAGFHRFLQTILFGSTPAPPQSVARLAWLYRASLARVRQTLGGPFYIIEARRIPNSERLPYTNVGKAVETAILYADVRGSTALHTQQEQTTTARMIKALLGELAQAARHFYAQIRGFAGDRIMVIVEQSDAPTKAVDVAVSMLDIVRRVLNPQLAARQLPAVSIGIGCDYGLMLAIKVGMQRTPENSDLIWVGGPANIASKLTDVAGTNEIVISAEVFGRLDIARYPNHLWTPRVVTVAARPVQAYALRGDFAFEDALVLARL